MFFSSSNDLFFLIDTNTIKKIRIKNVIRKTNEKTGKICGFTFKCLFLLNFYNLVYCQLFQYSLQFSGRIADISLRRENEANKENTTDDEFGVSKFLLI